MLLTACGETEPVRDDELFVPDVSGAEQSAEVVIDPSEIHQEIKGFGGINYPNWIEDLSQEQRETAFLNGDGQLGFTILRISVDPDPNNWEKELETAKYAQKQGAPICVKDSTNRATPTPRDFGMINTPTTPGI